MKKVIFSEKGKKKLLLEDAVYASTKNANKVNFNAVEIFDVNSMPTIGNVNHSEDSTQFFEIQWKTETKKKNIEDGVAYFSCSAVIDDEYVVENHEKVNGLSPEVYGGDYFTKDGQTFYKSSGEWKRTGVILDPEVPAMKGAEGVKKTIFSTNAKIFAKEINEEGGDEEEENTENTENIDGKDIKTEIEKTNAKIDALSSQFLTILKKLEEKEEEKEDEEIKKIESKIQFAKNSIEISEPSKLKSEATVNNDNNFIKTLKNLI